MNISQWYSCALLGVFRSDILCISYFFGLRLCPDRHHVRAYLEILILDCLSSYSSATCGDSTWFSRNSTSKHRNKFFNLENCTWNCDFVDFEILSGGTSWSGDWRCFFSFLSLHMSMREVTFWIIIRRIYLYYPKTLYRVLYNMLLDCRDLFMQLEFANFRTPFRETTLILRKSILESKSSFILRHMLLQHSLLKELSSGYVILILMIEHCLWRDIFLIPRIIYASHASLVLSLSPGNTLSQCFATVFYSLDLLLFTHISSKISYF